MSSPRESLRFFAGTLSLAVADQGRGRPFLLLHGGAGPASMAGLAGALGQDGRVVTPTHPGFDGHPRPSEFVRVADLVLTYLALLDQLDLTHVVVVGNSFGGWVAAEMALRASPRIAGIVLVNSVGIDTGSPDKLIVDPMLVGPAQRAALAFHDPARFAVAPSGPEAAARMADNQKTLRLYAGEPFMHDPTLRSRLARMTIPALVLWGASDGIVDVDYGRLLAGSIPNAQFELVDDAGHFPQIEQSQRTAALVRSFAGGLPGALSQVLDLRR